MAAILASCGSQGPTRLAIDAGYGNKGKTFHLRCSPAKGDVPDPAALCDTIGAHSGLMLWPRNTSVCTGDPMTSKAVAVHGVYRGKRVRMAVNECSLPEGFKAQRLWETGLPAPFGRR